MSSSIAGVGDSDASVCAVQAVHRQAGARVARVVDPDHVLRVAAHAVLGPEQRTGRTPAAINRSTA